MITGANSGIGLAAAEIIAAQGGHVIMACRDLARAEAASKSVVSGASGGGKASIVQLDLASFDSIKAGAESIRGLADNIDALVLNAGVMQPKGRVETKEGFEAQFGINHLGHFLLSGLLADRVEAAKGRFVSISSSMHKAGGKRIRFEDPNWKTEYKPAAAYAQSKLANALFARELNNRTVQSGAAARAYICHPGYAATPLISKELNGLAYGVLKVSNAISAQSPEKGSWPTVLCAASEDAEAGKYYGPTGFLDLRGPVGECKLAAQARDDEAAAKLWSLSEDLTGLSWTL